MAEYFNMAVDNNFKPELPHGWAGLCKVDYEFNGDYLQKYLETYAWIQDNVDNYSDNTQIFVFGGTVFYFFRKSNDMMLFKLRWSGA